MENTAWIIEMIRPLWITNYANTADLLYESLPCHRIKWVKYLNCKIEKSAANEAYIPSLPTIPRPTSAT
jgi:hypothetical protein